MKEINVDLVEPKENCIFKRHDYRKKRKGGANCYATAVFVGNLNTKELIKKFVEMVASDYPDKQFVIEHDGIIRFSVSCDDVIIFEGDHYDVESMMQEGTYVFRDLLLEKIKIM
ncbi:MAG: hypothetical protein ACI4U3_05310 [Traorella sp.]